MAEKIDKRIKRTRRLVSEAFIELVLEKGYDGVRIEDIIERADIARTTFYTHFKDKGDLLQKVALTFRERTEQRISTIQLNDEGLPTVEDLTISFRNIAENASIFRMALNPNGMPKFYDEIHQIIVDMMEKILNQQVNQTGRQFSAPVSLIAYHFAGGILSSAKWWLQENRVYLIPPEEMAALFLKLHRSSLMMD